MTEEINLTEFNSNKASLERIDRLLRLMQQAEMDEDIDTYYKLLKCLRKEAYYKMTGSYKEDREKLVTKWKNIQNKYEIYKRKKEYKFKNLILTELENYEIELRDFMGERGMLLTDKEDDEGL